MKLCRYEVRNACGHKLAHSHIGKSGRIPKASILKESDIQDLLAAGIGHVEVVISDPGDIVEDVVADRLVTHLDWANCRTRRANGGRFNIYAACDGLFHFEREQIDRFNSISEEITLATILPDTPVYAGDHVATLKIIPFYVDEIHVAKAEEFLSSILVAVMPWRLDLKVELMQSYNETITAKTQEKAYAIQNERLKFYGLSEAENSIVHHDVGSIANEILSADLRDVDVLLILGASAICDRQDIVPAALKAAGGNVSYFGMPVDPGNLMMLGNLSDLVIVGMPGCVRSPALNGLDLILDRLVAGLKIQPRDIQKMGVGGLLRAQPNRIVRPSMAPESIDALV